MKKIIVFSLFSILLVLSPISAFALSVIPTGDAGQLVNEILGAGITVSNLQYNGGSYASGTFTDGSDSIGMETGVILTTGTATDAEGPNSVGNITTDNGLPGDSDLNSLIPGYTTYDATILEFDFVFDSGYGGDLYFNFAFASDEYNEFTNTSFNDVFGFFIDGVNYAVLPGTSTPISINTVNGGGPSYLGELPVSNPEFYNNNDNGVFDIEYDGFTDVFLAEILGLDSGTHHISMAIADAGDHVLDSAVFIQGGTFSDTPTNPVPEPSTFILLGTGLLGLAKASRKKFKK